MEKRKSFIWRDLISQNINDAEGKEQWYQIKMPNRFPALENLDVVTMMWIPIEFDKVLEYKSFSQRRSSLL
jgi:hypothetical protein